MRTGFIESSQVLLCPSGEGRTGGNRGADLSQLATPFVVASSRDRTSRVSERSRSLVGLTGDHKHPDLRPSCAPSREPTRAIVLIDQDCISGVFIPRNNSIGDEGCSMLPRRGARAKVIFSGKCPTPALLSEASAHVAFTEGRDVANGGNSARGVGSAVVFRLSAHEVARVPVRELSQGQSDRKIGSKRATQKGVASPRRQIPSPKGDESASARTWTGTTVPRGRRMNSSLRRARASVSCCRTRFRSRSPKEAYFLPCFPSGGFA